MTLGFALPDLWVRTAEAALARGRSFEDALEAADRLMAVYLRRGGEAPRSAAPRGPHATAGRRATAALHASRAGRNR